MLPSPDTITRLRKAIVFGAVLCVGFVTIIYFATSRASRNTEQSRAALNQFYEAAQDNDYHRAHQLLSSRFGSILNAPQLEQQWRAFVKVHGSLKQWVPASDGTAGGSAVSLFPPYVDFTYRVTGSKGSSGYVVARLVPEGETWRIEKLNFLIA